MKNKREIIATPIVAEVLLSTPSSWHMIHVSNVDKCLKCNRCGNLTLALATIHE